MNRQEMIRERIQASIETKEKMLNDSSFIELIGIVGKLIAETIHNGGKIILAGNGGSGSDSLHIAGEIVGRFQRERKAWPAIVLNADVATLTAIANDYGYDKVFERQVEGHMNPEDVFLGISTSGDSLNILKAIEKAKEIGGITVGLCGKDGGEMAKIADYAFVVPSNITARIQESHIMIGHILCEIAEDVLTGN